MPRKKAAAKTETLPESPHQAAIATTPVEDAPKQDPKTSAPFDAEVHIVISGKVYERSSFSQEQITQISTVNFADQQLATSQQNLQIARLGRDALVEQLLDAIKDVPFVGVTEESAEE